jgi:hypothetical protein
MMSRHRQDGVYPDCPRTRLIGPNRFGARGRSCGADRRACADGLASAPLFL